MIGRMQGRIGAVLLPLLAAFGVALMIAARYIGGATLLPAILGGAGLFLCLAATVAGTAMVALPDVDAGGMGRAR